MEPGPRPADMQNRLLDSTVARKTRLNESDLRIPIYPAELGIPILRLYGAVVGSK